jgi:flagella basal body P-ring formation protein FlgA
MRGTLPLLLLLAGSAWAAPRAQIELLARVEAGEEPVRLGDVAHLRSTELPLMRHLVNLPIGPAPALGQSATASREAIAQWIRARAGLDAAGIAWSGAPQVQVVRATRQIAGERLADVAVQRLRAWLGERGQAAEVRVRSTPRDVDVPPGPLRLEARPPGSAAVRPRMVMWVDIWAADRFVRTVAVPMLVSAEASPLHAATASPAGLAPIATRAPVLGVARGEWAPLRALAGAVRLESRVEVLQDGRVGDRIRVRTPGAMGTVFATVVAPHQLELAR